MNDGRSQNIKSLSSLVKRDRYDRDLSPALRIERYVERIVNICVGQRWAGLSKARRWNSGERTSRDKTGKEGTRYRRCAGAPAREPPTLLPHCPQRVSPPATSRTMTRFVVRDVVIGNLRRGQFRERTNRLVASPISRMAIITRGIRRCGR